MAWIIDITHYLSNNKLKTKMSVPAKKYAEYIECIITITTINKSGIEHKTTISCKRRPHRKPCTGKLIVYCESSTSKITCYCPVCGDNGIISNWQGTRWDLRHA